MKINNEVLDLEESRRAHLQAIAEIDAEIYCLTRCGSVHPEEEKGYICQRVAGRCDVYHEWSIRWPAEREEQP